MKKIVLYASAAFSSGLFFTLLYNSIVNAANWESNIPQSIVATKEFFVVANPGSFFKMLDPANLILVVLAIILFWKPTHIRLYLGVAILCYITSMVLTFTYFYPRNEIMFLSEQLPDIDILEKAASEWGRMGWIRCLLSLAGLVCTLVALDKAPSVTQNSDGVFVPHPEK